MRPAIRALGFLGKVGFSIIAFWALMIELPAQTSTRASGANNDSSPKVEAHLEPDQVQVHKPTTYVVVVENARQVQINFPPVNGLTLDGEGGEQFSQSTVFNGLTMQSKTRITKEFIITPEVAGDMEIPAFPITTDGGNLLSTPRLTLHVSDLPAKNLAPNQPSNGPVIMPPPQPINPSASAPSDVSSSDVTTGDPNDPNKVPVDSDGQTAKLFMTITPHTSSLDIYVGQPVPVTIRTYIRADVFASQDSLPTLNDSDFLMNSLTNTQRYQADVGDQNYIVEQWETAITPTKPGDFPFQLSRQTNWVRPAAALPFSFFNDPSRREPTDRDSVPSNRLVWHVHDLPRENRPADFNGAIGDFQVVGAAQPSQIVVGQPITIQFSVNGTGNFDLVNCPAFPPTSDWKFYPAKATVRYSDAGHTQGIKNFTLEAIPKRSGTLALNSATLNYFNPDLKQYVSRTVPFDPVLVTEGTSAPVIAGTTPPSGAQIVAEQPTPPTTLFRPNHLYLDAGMWRDTSFYRWGAFWVAQTTLLGLLMLCFFAYLFRLQANAWAQSRLQQSRERQTLFLKDKALQNALSTGGAAQFFLAARGAIQWRLGRRWKINPDAITLSEIRQRDELLASTLTPIFEQSDAVLFSREPLGVVDLNVWAKYLNGLLAQLEGKTG